MYAALQEAIKAFDEDEVPIGAVIVHQNKIISRGYNQIEKLKDATAHAEMIAITSAANRLGNWRLNDCSLYVTLEPCIMCTGAILNSRISEVYFSTYDTKSGACGSIYNIPDENRTNHHLKVYSGLMAEESSSLLRDFFESLRNKPNSSNFT
jgi:tRNA-adenosine deaminase (EC 3.5.4.-)